VPFLAAENRKEYTRRQLTLPAWRFTFQPSKFNHWNSAIDGESTIMGRVTIAAFKPKPGREMELLRVIADRLPLLRRLGLATGREHILMRSREGVIVEVSEWISDEAINKAHQTPEVLALWERFDACCVYVKLDTLAEAHEDFATFDAI
jgi:hypothetical protein